MDTFETVENQEEKELQSFAKKLIQKAENGITSRIPAFTYAFENMELCLMPFNVERISTDGTALFANAKQVVETYQRKGIGQIQYELLHILMHLMCGDIKRYRESAHKELFSAVADERVYELLEELKKGGEQGTYEDAYYANKYDEKKQKEFIEQAAKKYKSDDHSLWNEADSIRADEFMREFLEAVFGERKDALESSEGAMGQAVRDFFMKENVSLSDDGLKETCTGSAQKMRSGSDYGSVIRKLFSDICKEKTSRENYDRNLYCYGFDVYGDVPILEEGENETEGGSIEGKVAIAIDTSGSCRGEPVCRFLGEILKLLKQMSSMEMDELQIVLLQCDDHITFEKTYKGEEIIKALSKPVNLKGFGGTDFTPVFDRMYEMERRGEKIAGVIYFSDGMGSFPKGDKKPDFPVIFVLPKDGSHRASFPRYVQKAFFGGN